MHSLLFHLLYRQVEKKLTGVKMIEHCEARKHDLLLCLADRKPTYLTAVTAVNVAVKALKNYLVETEIYFQIYLKTPVQHL